MKTATLKRNYFQHRAGDTVKVLSYYGSGLYTVQFSNGNIERVGRSLLQAVE